MAYRKSETRRLRAEKQRARRRSKAVAGNVVALSSNTTEETRDASSLANTTSPTPEAIRHNAFKDGLGGRIAQIAFEKMSRDDLMEAAFQAGKESVVLPVANAGPSFSDIPIFSIFTRYVERYNEDRTGIDQRPGMTTSVDDAALFYLIGVQPGYKSTTYRNAIGMANVNTNFDRLARKTGWVTKTRLGAFVLTPKGGGAFSYIFGSDPK